MSRRLIPHLSPWLRWESERDQYDRPDINDRSPGVHHWTVPLSEANGVVIECLLHYGPDRNLTGVLNYFPHGTPMLDQPGDFLVLVDPDHRRRGIGAALVREAVWRWQVDLHNQALTPEGLALITTLEREHA